MSDTSAPKKASTSPMTSLWQWAKPSPVKEPVTDPQESKLKKYQKRREQVRRAQRNHREKKEKYLHFLETEVASLRKEKILLTQRAEKAEAEIQRLTQDMPNLNATVVHSNVQPLVTVSISHGTGSEKALHVDVAGSLISATKNTHPISCKCSPTDPDKSCPEISPTNHHDLLTSNDTSHLYSETTNIPAELSAAFSYSPAANNQSMAQTDQFYVSSNNFWKTTLPPQTLQKGIDFVLALEKPCLAHIMDQPESASGHALTVQAALMNYTFVPDKSGSACCQVPAVVVERLLQLSYSLPLWGEITPVQAWQRLSNRPGFDRYDAQRLREFQAAISSDVRCYGFGAVIDEKDFERLSSHFFPQL